MQYTLCGYRALLQLPHTPCDDSQHIVKTLILVNILLLQYFRMLLHNYSIALRGQAHDEKELSINIPPKPT